MRILVTGSRDWSDEEAVAFALLEQDPCAEHDDCFMDEHLITVVHGDCPTGADAIADKFARQWGVEVEPHAADWSRGRRAGPERNAHMVNLGADVCLAFIGDCTSPRCKRTDKHPSHGASGCADLAEAAGIPVRRFYA